MPVVRLCSRTTGPDSAGGRDSQIPQSRTIEGVIVAQLEHVLREPVKLSVAGRTDAGVHARGQVASFTTSSSVPPERLQKALNGTLAPEVVVLDARDAPEGSTRGSPRASRAYVYRIHEAVLPDPFTARFVWHRPGHLLLGPMREAARSLLGEHDFASFCRRPGGDRSTVRDLRRPHGGSARGRPFDPSRGQRVPPSDGSIAGRHARGGGGGRHRSRRDAGHPRRS